MIVDLPVGSREAVMVVAAPPSNGLVRTGERSIRTEMRRPCDRACRRCRACDLAVLGKRPKNLHADFESNAAIPIDSDMAAGRRVLCPQGFPDQATALRYDARELGRARLAPDHSQRDAIEPLEPDGVRGHGQRSPRCWADWRRA